MRLPAMFFKKCQHVRGQQLFHPSVLPWHVDRTSSCLLPHNRASLISVHEFVGGGELNCKAKVQVLVVTPSPPLFFLEVGRKKGGGVTAGQFGVCVRYACACADRKSTKLDHTYPYVCMRMYVQYGTSVLLSEECPIMSLWKRHPKLVGSHNSACSTVS